jgi:hypothetical protein
MTKTAQLAIARGLAEQTRGTGVTVNSMMHGRRAQRVSSNSSIRWSINKDACEGQRKAEFFTKMRPLSLIRRLMTLKRWRRMLLSSPVR